MIMVYFVDITMLLGFYLDAMICIMKSIRSALYQN